jgi:hypothetical protein
MTSAPPTRLSTFDRALLGVVLTLALASALALFLAQVGVLHVGLVLVILATIAVVAWRRTPRRESSGKEDVGGDRLSILLLCTVVAIAIVILTPPFQTTLWGGDATLYVGYGVQIGRSGAYVFEDPLLAGMPLEIRQELFRNQNEDDMTGRQARFPGGIGFVDIAAGRVAPGFSPLFPVWLALFSQLFGAAHVFWVSSFFGVCGVAATFCLGRELHSRHAGLWASLWLLACMPQIWFSRIPMSEAVSQFFLLGGLWVSILYMRTEGRMLAAAGGFVLGIAGLTGFDVVITTTAGVLAFVAAGLFAGRRIANARYFVAAYSTVVVYGLAHLAHYPSNYGVFLEVRVPRLPFGTTIMRVLSAATPEAWLALGLAALAFAVFVSTRLIRRLARDEQTRRRYAALTLGFVLALYLTAYFFGSKPRYSESVHWFPAYLSWPLVLLFFAGLAGIAWRRGVVARDTQAAGLLAAFAVTSIPLLYNPQLQDFGVHIGTMRRYVPVVIPGIFLVAAIGFAGFVQRLPSAARWITVPLVGVLVAALVAQPGMMLFEHRLWDNGVAESAELAAMFPPSAVILVAPDLVGVQAQAALTFWHGFGAVALNRSYAVDRLIEGQVARWLREGREVFLLSATSDMHFDGSNLSLSEHGSDELAVRTLAKSSRVPHRMEVRQVRMTAYSFRIDPAPKTHVDVGSYTSDALFPLAGFYGAETDSVAGRRYRWTGPRASIVVPTTNRLTMVLQGARPPGIAPAVVSIAANGRSVLENASVSSQSTRIELDLSDLDLAGPVTVTIDSSTFNPRSSGLSDDERDLGVRVYRVDFDGAGDSSLSERPPR